MILREGHPSLNQVCRPFVFGEDDPRALADRLTKAMRAERGVGLAAPQIGVEVCAFVILDGEGVVECFNPLVAVYQDGRERILEGCLSYPGVHVYVKRWRGLTARFQDAHGHWKDRRLVGQAAQAYQHELDHLDGRTLPNLVPAQAFALAKAKAKLKVAA